MKALIVIAAAAAFAFPVYAQQKQDAADLPNAQERAQNRETVADKTDKATDKLPSAEERAKNRETVSSSAAGAALTTKVKSALAADAGMKHRDQHRRRQQGRRGDAQGQGRLRRPEEEGRRRSRRRSSGVKSVKNELKVEKKS